MINTPTTDALNALIPLTNTPPLIPGRPHVSAVWRWCRRGVLARSGERVRLEHVRMGGKLFTSKAWIDAFARTLAAADTAYFNRKAEAAAALPPRDPKYGPPSRRPRSRAEKTPRAADRRQDELSAELDAEGL